MIIYIRVCTNMYYELYKTFCEKLEMHIFIFYVDELLLQAF